MQEHAAFQLLKLSESACIALGLYNEEVAAMLGARNRIGLSEQQLDKCIAAWALLCGEHPRVLDTGEVIEHGSRTRFVQDRHAVILGADAHPGSGTRANSRMPMLTCLAHELAHVERFEVGYRRPFDAPDSFIDEAETSLCFVHLGAECRRS